MGFITLNKTVIVNSLDDLPTPIGDVITLTDYIAYQIDGPIDLGICTIILGQSNIIFGSNRLTDIISTSSTGALITGTNKSLVMDCIQLSAPNGSIFNMSGSGTQTVSIIFSIFQNTKSFGVIGGFNFLIIRNNRIKNCTISGISFSGNTTNAQLFDNRFDSNAGVSINFGSATFDSLVISRNHFTINTTQIGISGLAASGNINIGGTGRLTDNTFRGTGGVYVTSISKAGIRWEFGFNSNLDNSEVVGNMSMVGNTVVTNIITTSIPVKVAGNTNAGVLERFLHTTGRLTYIGIKTVTVQIIVSVTFKDAVATIQSFQFNVAKNGIIIAEITSKHNLTTSNFLQAIILTGLIALSTNDYVELYVRNNSSSQDVTIDSMNFSVK